MQQIGRTGRAMYAAFEQQVGYPLPRWRILAALIDLEQATQKQLATRLSMDPGALTRQLKAMEGTRWCAASPTRPTTARPW